MNNTSTAREALIAEALGEVGALLGRLEALAPKVDELGDTAWRAYVNLIDRINRFENQVQNTINQAESEALRRIQRHAEHITRQSLETQAQAMKTTARELFRTEFDPATARVLAQMQALAHKRVSTRMVWIYCLMSFFAGADLMALVVQHLPHH
jgi:hypothetical protein